VCVPELFGKVVCAMFATARATAIVLCFLAVGACRKNMAHKTGATVDRGPVIDSHTLIAPSTGRSTRHSSYSSAWAW